MGWTGWLERRLGWPRRLGWSLRRHRAFAQRNSFFQRCQHSRCAHRSCDVGGQRWTLWCRSGGGDGSNALAVDWRAHDGWESASRSVTREFVGERAGSGCRNHAQQRRTAFLWIGAQQHGATGIVPAADCKPAADDAAKPRWRGSCRWWTLQQLSRGAGVEQHASERRYSCDAPSEQFRQPDSKQSCAKCGQGRIQLKFRRQSVSRSVFRLPAVHSAQRRQSVRHECDASAGHKPGGASPESRIGWAVVRLPPIHAAKQ